MRSMTEGLSAGVSRLDRGQKMIFREKISFQTLDLWYGFVL